MPRKTKNQPKKKDRELPEKKKVVWGEASHYLPSDSTSTTKKPAKKAPKAKFSLTNTLKQMQANINSTADYIRAKRAIEKIKPKIKEKQELRRRMLLGKEGPPKKYKDLE